MSFLTKAWGNTAIFEYFLIPYAKFPDHFSRNSHRYGLFYNADKESVQFQSSNSIIYMGNLFGLRQIISQSPIG
ncbi:hypothetical protein N7488_005182 [Penicillium malachiteum]|nr:hypothetical protein N7488_005182 [Penicillium malachiteum]